MSEFIEDLRALKTTLPDEGQVDWLMKQAETQAQEIERLKTDSESDKFHLIQWLNGFNALWERTNNEEFSIQALCCVNEKIEELKREGE